MKNTRVSTFKVAATYIGTVVGAGFASGQEVLQFFAVFGKKGFAGLLVTTALFIIFGYIIMDLGKKLNSSSHLRVIRFSGGKYLGTAIDFVITFFLIGALTAMIAGAGAMFSQQFGVPAVWGNLIMAAATAITVLTGINGIINSISFVVPFLLVSAVGISIVSISSAPAGINMAAAVPISFGLVRNWLWSAILYTSYNTVISVAVLAPLGAKAADRKTIRNGAILGGLGLGVGAAAIYAALVRNLGSVLNLEIPMAFIAGHISYTVQMMYALVLLSEIYTTAVGNLYGFAARITGIEGRKGTLFIIGSTVFAFIASRLGFSTFVKYLYPIIGYGGIILLVSLLYSKAKEFLQKS